MSETWLTSDTHLGHDKVAQIRGFEDHREHDEHLARRWDKRVCDGDEVWVLGDLAMNGWADRIAWFTQRPGIKHLVLGNHDRAHPMHRNSHKHLRTFLAVFETVQTSASMRNGRLLLSHFPYDGEGVTRDADKHERGTQWRLRDEGVPLLHGHVHDAITVRPSLRHTPMLHVGPDAWDMAPVTLHDALVPLDVAA